jgi:hypothetical protein
MLAEATNARCRTDTQPVGSYPRHWLAPPSYLPARHREMPFPAKPILGVRQMNQGMMASHENHIKEMQACIDACSHCHATCLHTAMVHCLDSGGKHVGADHFRLMMNCAEICQTSASFQLSGSSFHRALCGICADICEACAKSCESIGDMEDCVKACRDCAASCRKMSAKK